MSKIPDHIRAKMDAHGHRLPAAGVPSDPAQYPWPGTDTDYAPGGIYDQNTEEGKRRYEHAYVVNQRKAWPAAPEAYTPTLQGFQWMTWADFQRNELEWVIGELQRELHNMSIWPSKVDSPNGYTSAQFAEVKAKIAAAQAALQGKG